jgi:hypothetical protein
MSLVTAALIGALAWRGPILALVLPIAVPWLIFHQQTRLNATAVALAYFSAASAPAIAVTEAFAPGTVLHGWLIWLLASAILSLPWALLWSARSAQWIWRCPLALAVCAVPPVGLICWASPLLSAGLLFPGTGLVGVAATAFVPVVWPVRPLLLTATMLLANLLYRPTLPTTAIEPLNTKDSADLFQKEEAARTAIDSSHSALVVLPEGAVRRWTEATEVFWAPTIEHLQATHRIALVGVGLPIAHSKEFQNAVLVIGDERRQVLTQRIPIPVGMWKPFGPSDGVPLNLTGPGIIHVGRERLAILICYEQLLIWPVLQSAFEKPSLLVGVSNAAWTRQTNIPAVQEACLFAWSRLFGIPFISAVNS